MSGNWSVFDIIGPVMIGPSSSHTAGACRLGLMVNRIFGIPDEVEIQLHGSFAKVYKGHGTDKALVAGILGFDSDDERLIKSFQLAEDQGLKFNFSKNDFGSKYHPNTVKFKLKKDNQVHTMIGSSIGGGNIEIISIDGVNVEGLDGANDFTIFGGIDTAKLEELRSMIKDYDSKYYEIDKEALVLIPDKVQSSLLDQITREFKREKYFWGKTVLALK